MPKTYQTTTAAPPQPMTTPTPANANVPHWAPDTMNTLKVPAGQAAIGAAIWTGGVLIASTALAVVVPAGTFEVKAALVAFLVVTTFLIAFASYWFPYRDQAMDSLRQYVEWQEERDGKDYNGDGIVGSHPVVVRGRVRRESPEEVAARQWREDVEAFVYASFEAKTTGEKKLVGLGLSDGRSLTMERYNTIRDAMLRANWATWRNSNDRGAGWWWTVGRAEDIIYGIFAEQ